MEDDAESIEGRAVWFTAPRCVELRAERVPAPGGGEVRVQALASAVSHGTEMLVYRGQVPPDLPLDLPTLAGSFHFPVKYGYASVGRVLDVGAEVRELQAGDLVFVHHPHQSAYLVPATMPVRISADIDPLLGLFLANMETAINVLLDTPVHLGEAAVVFGQGTVGILIAQLLKLAGAGLVVGIDPFQRRQQAAREAGIDAALAPEEGLLERIRALTGGRGADVAIDASGSATALQSAIDCVAPEGTVIAVSWYGTKPVTLSLGGHFHRGRVRLRSSQVGQINPDLSPRWDRTRRMQFAQDLLGRLRLRHLISHQLPFDRAADAYRLVDERAVETVQVVLTYGPPPGGID